MPAELAYLAIEDISEYDTQIETEEFVNCTILCSLNFWSLIADALTVSKIIPRYTTISRISENRQKLSVPEWRDVIDADMARNRPIPLQPGDVLFGESRRKEKRAHGVATESALKRPTKTSSRCLREMNKQISRICADRDHVIDLQRQPLSIDIIRSVPKMMR